MLLIWDYGFPHYIFLLGTFASFKSWHNEMCSRKKPEKSSRKWAPKPFLLRKQKANNQWCKDLQKAKWWVCDGFFLWQVNGREMGFISKCTRELLILSTLLTSNETFQGCFLLVGFSGFVLHSSDPRVVNCVIVEQSQFQLRPLQSWSWIYEILYNSLKTQVLNSLC